MSLNNNISKDNEIFLKEFLKDFYRQIIKIEYYPKFRNILKEWIKDYLNYNEKNPEIILKLMENHKENENWFSSLIGFFYEHILDKKIDKCLILNFYLSSIKNYENDDDKKKLNSMYQLINIIISKYLLSFHYYRDIILDKNDFMVKNLENVHVMSHGNDQFENFNGLKINLRKDEINIMEKYFDSLDKCPNEIQSDYIKKKESE
ncbi:unnamed protein product [Rhizophagus irregularis]|nr:unnamed protein product [Rhizophagus irregularis]CAB5366769.1 unnamed protein product [Rhizophagus irregularis]